MRRQPLQTLDANSMMAVSNRLPQGEQLRPFTVVGYSSHSLEPPQHVYFPASSMSTTGMAVESFPIVQGPEVAHQRAPRQYHQQLTRSYESVLDVRRRQFSAVQPMNAGKADAMSPPTPLRDTVTVSHYMASLDSKLSSLRTYLRTAYHFNSTIPSERPESANLQRVWTLVADLTAAVAEEHTSCAARTASCVTNHDALPPCHNQTAAAHTSGKRSRSGSKLRTEAPQFPAAAAAAACEVAVTTDGTAATMAGLFPIVTHPSRRPRAIPPPEHPSVSAQSSSSLLTCSQQLTSSVDTLTM